MQNQVFIVRRVTDVPPDHHKHDIFPVELYNVPINLTHQPIEENVNAVERVFLLDYVFVNVHITDHYHPTHDDESLQRHVLGNHSKPPRPISIIGTTTAPDGLVRLTFYPDKVEQWFPPTPVASSSSSSSRSSSPFSTKHEDKWAYSLTDCSAVRYIASPRDTGYRILPGSYRSIVYAVPKDDITNAPSIVEIKRYGDEETLRRPTPEEMADPGYMRAPRKPFHQFFWEMEKGVRVKAMAWDETIGRLCMVVEKSQVVFMLDFSKAPQEGALIRIMTLFLQNG